MIKTKKQSCSILLFFSAIICAVLFYTSHGISVGAETNIKEQNTITAIWQAEKECLKITMDSGEIEYSKTEFWIKQKSDIYSWNSVEPYAQNHWMIINNGENGGESNSVCLDKTKTLNSRINGNYYIYVVAQTQTEKQSFYKIIPVEETEPTIKNITIDSRPLEEFNYFVEGTEITINAELLNAQEFNLESETQTLASQNAEIKYIVQSGKNTINLSAGGNIITATINGYAVLDSYTKITDVKLKGGADFGENIYSSSVAEFEVFTEGVGKTALEDSSIRVKAAVLVDGMTVTFSDYGVYTVVFEIVNNLTGAVEDYYLGYYNYSRSDNLKLTLESELNSNGLHMST